ERRDDWRQYTLDPAPFCGWHCIGPCRMGGGHPLHAAHENAELTVFRAEARVAVSRVVVDRRANRARAPRATSRLSAFVLERQLHARAECDDFSVVDPYVELRDFGDAQVANGL